MSGLTATDFTAFFSELHGRPPFPWQNRLTTRVCESGWPETIDLPTASGKTACIDIAVFAMAVTGRGPRRIFFVVDRRIVVGAAFERMRTIACKLRQAKEGMLKVVADRLRAMSAGPEPLDTYQLRGGVYRDDSWVRKALQPTAIASTVDQVGSRLLFRGYGVWDKTLPIHAALIANDSLILLDEAHCSRAFAETLAAVQRYRAPTWADEPVESPFAFIEMTATPSRPSADRFELDGADLQNEVLSRRLHATKPVRYQISKARTKDLKRLADDLTAEAIGFKDKGLRRIAVIVNRVRTARLVYEALHKDEKHVHLLIGRMRPVDRAALHPDIDSMLSGNSRSSEGEPVFVVATQCLEVGADLDFDAVVTECASIDALLQRFGRLDRIGDLHRAGVTAQGVIVIASPMTDASYSDPVYGASLAKTWHWLKARAPEANFGFSSHDGRPTVPQLLRLPGLDPGNLRRQGHPAPVMLPAHLDLLVQTSPRPALEPDVALFLHGKERGSPDVQVVWRADLDLEASELWTDIVGMCPPVSTEAMTVSLADFRRWLTGSGEPNATTSDLEDASESISDDDGRRGSVRCPALIWCGDQSKLVESAADVRPGDTLVLAESSLGWNELGHVPKSAAIDVAEQARHDLRRGPVLRLHPKLIAHWKENEQRLQLEALAKDRSAQTSDLLKSLGEYQNTLEPGDPAWLTAKLPLRTRAEAYPAKRDAHIGWILSAPFAEADAGSDESSAASPTFLDQHLSGVTQQVDSIATALLSNPALTDSLHRAARHHDYGKADQRFQALLHGGDLIAAQFAPRLLAKGAQGRQSKSVRTQQWVRSGLPDGFRHELVSLLLAMQSSEVAPDALALHLIASHHGRCRPFAPVVDDSGPDLEHQGLRITAQQRVNEAAHRIDTGVADRFWQLRHSPAGVGAP
jgi:CRISPR-associated endonuclease/helicase Cas3